MKKRLCAYSDCQLPKNNNKYFAQLILLIIVLLFMIKDVQYFTLVSVFLFVAPVTLDLICTDLQPKWLNTVRIIFIIYNLVICLLSFSGIFGLITEQKTYFLVVETSMMWPEYIVNKDIVLYLLFIDLIIPWMFWKGAPNQAAAIAVYNVLEDVGVNK